MCGEAGEGQNDGNNNAAAAQNDIEAQAFGISTGIGNPNAEVDDFDDTSDFSVDPNAEPDDFDDTSNFGPDPNAEPDDFDNQQQDKSLLDSVIDFVDENLNQKNVVDLGMAAVGIPSKGMRGVARGIGEGLDGLFGGEAPDQAPSTGSEGGPESDFGESGNFGGIGLGGGNTGGDGAELPPSELARSVRSAGVAPTPAAGASRRLTPALAPAVPAGPTQADLDRERRAQSEERRRRASRRQGRESTIVTGPLGVFGPPQLLRPRAVPGASKRLLGA